MRILNATQRTLSLMTDNGDLMSIPPGELSKLFIGSKNMVMTAVRAGSQNEIGIIYGSTYELEIARTVSVALPYLYATEEEAIEKLINKNVDYHKKKEASANKDDKALTQANSRIKELEKEIEELKKGAPKTVDTEVLEAEIERLNKELKASEDSKLELTGSRTLLDNLEKEVKENYIPQIEELKTNLKEVSKERDEFKIGLEKAIKQIDAMKDDFNTACKEFGLSKKDGKWVQEPKGK